MRSTVPFWSFDLKMFTRLMLFLLTDLLCTATIRISDIDMLYTFGVVTSFYASIFRIGIVYVLTFVSAAFILTPLYIYITIFYTQIYA